MQQAHRKQGAAIRVGRSGSHRFALTAVALSVLVACERNTIAGVEVAPRIVSATHPTITQPGTYRLQVGDVVNVFVFNNPDLSLSTAVTPDGRISFPLVGAFQAGGRTLAEVEAIIARGLADDIVAPQVTVSITEVQPYRIFISGEVVQPGVFEVREAVTLVQAVALAGGFTVFAEPDRILVYNPRRTDGARRLFNYDRFLADPMAQDVLLGPGDTVIVP